MAKSEADILTGISAGQRLARPFPQVTVVEPGRGIEPRTYSLRALHWFGAVMHQKSGSDQQECSQRVRRPAAVDCSRDTLVTLEVAVRSGELHDEHRPARAGAVG